MSESVIFVFRIIGTLLLSCLAWWLVMIGPMQELMYEQSYSFFTQEWTIRTGHDGMDTETETAPIWNSTYSYM